MSDTLPLSLLPPAAPLEAARAAEAAGDWPAAAALWQPLMAEHPVEAARGLARALRLSGAAGAARRVLGPALARSPQAMPLWREEARAAALLGDLPAATTAWRRLLDRLPGDAEAWLGLLAALRRAGATDLRAREEAAAWAATPAPARLDPRLRHAELARLAQQREEWEAARASWEAVLALPGPQGEAAAGLLAALRRLGRLEEATARLAALAALLPDSPTLLAEAARLAQARQDWPEAARHWAALRACAPDRPAGYIEGAHALCHLGERAAAEDCLRAGQERLGALPELLLAQAQLPGIAALHRAAVEEVVARLRALLRHRPSLGEARPVLLRRLLQLGRLEEAAELAATLPPPLAEPTAVTLAELHRQRGEWPAALALLRAARRDFPGRPMPWHDLARTLSEAGQAAEAEAEASAAIAAFPRHARLRLLAAELALARRDRPAVRAAWLEAVRLCRHDPAQAPHLDTLRFQAAGLGLELEAEDILPEGQGAPEMQRLMERFVSLGGARYGCEFGLAQQAFGAVTLSLLRWAGIGLPALLAGLAEDFAGVGEVGQTRLDAPGLPGGEYMLRDLRYGIHTHTFLHRLPGAPEEVLRQSCERLAWLRRRLLRQLAEGRHVFVYRRAYRQLEEEEMHRLHAAIRRHGPGRLLCVRRSEDPGLWGQVRVIGPGLMVGHVARFALHPGEAERRPVTRAWAALCQKAAALVEG
ncbi:tetratricopeptide repeat protein [Roseomonas sp. GC11]|uniref:tetratricopeptide repeat protein n=1 Tax=Roseomonas sp. GC11 TaxID=2950546 RepID=UPI00210CAE7B|nr:tetratricopeptide repeat protein [Roseomonas sp. GC11]MCQ4162086.1 tetratricopeptide repeat protein [Roseomonas sp. GC11]